MGNNDRFIRSYFQGITNVVEIWVDKVTGVNYIYRKAGNSGGLTVMVDKDGKPVITPVEDMEKYGYEN